MMPLETCNNSNQWCHDGKLSLRGCFGSRASKRHFEIFGFICSCVAGDIILTPDTLFGLFPCFTLSRGPQLNLGNLLYLLGTACFTLRFGGLGSIYFSFLDYLKFHFLLFFCIFPDLGSGFLTCAHCEDALDLGFTSSEQSGTVFTVPCGDYSVEQSINWRHLHSALQPAGELRGRLWNGGKRGWVTWKEGERER